MDILDTRDLQARLEELEGVIEDYMDEKGLEELSSEDEVEAFGDENDYEELKELRTMVDEVGSEWIHGEMLINTDYWEEYVEDLCKDIGDLPQDIPFYIVIDWERTAENIRADYGEVEYLGESYYYRMS